MMIIMLFTRKNFIKAFALSIPLVVFNLVNRPFEHLLNDVIVEPSTELAQFIVISSSIFTLGISVISILICIKIWNKYSKPRINI